MKRQYLQPQTYSVAQVCHNCIMGNSPTQEGIDEPGTNNPSGEGPINIPGRLYR